MTLLSRINWIQGTFWPRIWRGPAMLLFTCLFCTVPVQAQEPIIHEPWIRLMPPGAPNSVAYLEIQSSQEDVLLGAACDEATKVEIHEMSHQDGVMKMSKREQLPLPAGERVRLKPHGLHLMLLGMKRSLQLGEQISITLEFEKAGSVPVTATVRQ